MLGKEISHYRILEKLGAGGMGVVYKAQDTKLKRTVALKFLPKQISLDETEKKRFIHEAQAAAALDHPNICNIYEIDETKDGQMFIAMGYYEGKTLKDLIGKGEETSPLQLDKAIDIALQIAEGLQEAHEHKIIHRDIKSANIVVTGKGTAKILDFGLAKLKGATKLTVEGTTLGTVAYMSPEQVNGEEADHRSDIWSLGVVLYEMLTGQPPFKGEYDQALMYAIMNEEPEAITGLRSGIPLELEKIINKLLSKAPQQRYQHMDDLTVDLKQLLKGRDTKKVAPKMTRKSNRFLKILAGIVLLGFLIILVFTILDGDSEPELKRKMLVVLPFENLGNPEDEYFTAGVTDEITTRLAMIKSLGVISRSSAQKYAGSRKTVQEIGRQLGVQYILKGTVRWARLASGSGKVRISPRLIQVSDDTHLWADTYDREINDIFKVQADIARNVAQELNITLGKNEAKNVEMVPTRNLEAYHTFLKAEHLLGQPHFNQHMWPQVIKNYEKAVELDPEFALAWAELARAHARLIFFNLDLSKERYEKARAAAEKAIRLEPGSPKVHLALSYYYLYISRNVDRALQELDFAEKMLPNSSSILYARATIYEVRGRYRDMIVLLEKAHKLSPLSAGILTQMAGAYLFSRQYPEAMKTAARARILAPDAAWPNLYPIMTNFTWKGAVRENWAFIEKVPARHSWKPFVMFIQYIGEGKYREALDWIKKAPEEGINTKMATIPRTMAMADLYWFMGDTHRARTYYFQARSYLEAQIAQKPTDPRLHGSLAVVLASLGERKGALRHGKQAVQILSSEKDVTYGPEREMDLVLVYNLLGEYDAALDIIEKLFSIDCYPAPGWFNLDPRWERLKKQPRYKKIIQEFQKKYSR